MRKILSIILICIVTVTYSTSSFATSNLNESVAYTEMKGTVLSEETLVTQDALSNISTVSYEEKDDGSITIYQYINGIMTEEHTTIPGCGIVYHKFYNDDGTFIEETEFTKEFNKYSVSSVDTNIPDSTSQRSLGYMHYYNSWVNKFFSINCYVREAYFENRPYTFGMGTAASLAEWTSKLISIWCFGTGSTSIASFIIGLCDSFGIFEKSLTGIYTVLVTKTVVCNFSNQEIHGDATSPSTNYPHGRLDGTYAVININGQTNVKTEGYTVRNWRDPAMGRMMMYKVFSIDAAPTSWSDS